MSLARHMARLLAVMIVTIVAGLGVSAAQAHDGHARRASGHVHASAGAASVAVVAEAASAKASTVRTNPAPQADAPDGCDLGCLTCMACCHSVLMPAVSVELPSPARPARRAAPQAAIPPCLAPEALPRPPRPFA